VSVGQIDVSDSAAFIGSRIRKNAVGQHYPAFLRIRVLQKCRRIFRQLLGL